VVPLAELTELFPNSSSGGFGEVAPAAAPGEPEGKAHEFSIGHLCEL
jgi:hypothetical protein